MNEINFFWEPLSDNILQERDEMAALTAEYTAEPVLYGNVISQDRSGVESQFHYDAQGSTLAVTDDDQNVTDTFAYSAFGEVTERTGTIEVPFQYIGQKGYYADELTGQILVRERLYEPMRARWYSSMTAHLARDDNPYPYATGYQSEHSETLVNADSRSGGSGATHPSSAFPSGMPYVTPKALQSEGIASVRESERGTFAGKALFGTSSVFLTSGLLPVASGIPCISRIAVEQGAHSLSVYTDGDCPSKTFLRAGIRIEIERALEKIPPSGTPCPEGCTCRTIFTVNDIRIGLPIAFVTQFYWVVSGRIIKTPKKVDPPPQGPRDAKGPCKVLFVGTLEFTVEAEWGVCE